MNPTSEILERVNKSSSEHHDGVFTRLFRYLLREDIYFAAYQKLYANSGAMTPGSDNDTADGFSAEYVYELIEVRKVQAEACAQRIYQETERKNAPTGYSVISR